jgi:hypothetical protein
MIHIGLFRLEEGKTKSIEFCAFDLDCPKALSTVASLRVPCLFRFAQLKKDPSYRFSDCLIAMWSPKIRLQTGERPPATSASSDAGAFLTPQVCPRRCASTKAGRRILLERLRTLPPESAPITSAQIDPGAPLVATNPPSFKRLRRSVCPRPSPTSKILFAEAYSPRRDPSSD